jgi:hypothetical protein
MIQNFLSREITIFFYYFDKIYRFVNVIGDAGASLRGTHHMDAPHHDALSCARDGLQRSACWVVGVQEMAAKP